MEIGSKKLEFKCMTECTENLNIEMLKVSFLYFLITFMLLHTYNSFYVCFKLK